MREVSDDFLLNMAQVSSALVGLFLVGIFFYADTGFRRTVRARNALEPYLRVSTVIVLVLYSIPIMLSMSLVVLEPVWSRALFADLSLLLVATNVVTAVRLRNVERVTHSTILVANEVIGTVSVIVLVTLPWALGGLEPSREDLTWAILLSFTAGFLSVCTIVMSVFDVSRADVAD
jgi:hypothetical protein